jgi:Domain found in Dishevelled, Egl-10, and Pleckstrin (DEP)
MSETNAPTAILCLPKGDARNAMRAALAAMQIESQDILPSRADLAKLSLTLRTNMHAVAIIDLAGIRHAAANIVALAALLPDASARQRIVLTRSHCGLWPTDRTWAQELGFADLYAQLDSISLLAESSGVLDWVAKLVGAAPIATAALKQYLHTAQIKPDSTSQRGFIRKTTGITAEALCAALASNVPTQDRTYNLKHYPSCFLGKEAVDWLTKEYAVTKDDAVRLGAALQELGMLHHVAHEQLFGDEPFFYRTELSAVTQRMSPGATLSLISSKSGVVVRERSYHGTTYAACFVGSHAVDWLHSKLKLSRLDAEIMLNRLYGFDLIEHVTREHPVQDGTYFYRFVS